MSEVKVSSSAADLRSTAVADYIQIANYDEIVEVMRSRKFVQGSHYEARKTIMKDTLIVLDGKSHLQRRTILNKVLNDGSIIELRQMHLAPAVERCIAEVKALSPDKDGVIATDLSGLVQRCVYRVAAAVAGIDGIDSTAAADRMIAQIKTITSGFTVEWSKEPSDEVSPERSRPKRIFVWNCLKRRRRSERNWWRGSALVRSSNINYLETS